MAFVSARIVEATLRRNAVLRPIRLDVVAELVDDDIPEWRFGAHAIRDTLRVHHGWAGTELAELLALTPVQRRATIRVTMRALLRERYAQWLQQRRVLSEERQDQDMTTVAPYTEEEVTV